MAAILELKFFNSFWLKKLDTIVEVENTTATLEAAVDDSANIIITEVNADIGVGQSVNWEGTTSSDVYVYAKTDSDDFILNQPVTIDDETVLTFGPITNFDFIPNAYAATEESDWFVEEARIRGGYNNTNVDLGVKAYIVEDNINQQHRKSSLIYSGIFNSRTGINNTNQFSVGEDITRSLDPYNGSIQKLYSENTNLTIFQEFKVSRALIDKDAVYSAEGEPMTTSGSQVIGQVQAYAGNYGIATNPESFAVYGYRKYFTDRNQGAVLRLSQDGITEISEYGMSNFFRDTLSVLDDSNLILGMWDMHNKEYVLSLQNTNGSYNTLSFDEDVQGWTSFYDYKPNHGDSLRNDFYTFKYGKIWKHYATSVNRGNFYTLNHDSTVHLVFNPDVSVIKTFKTVNYEGRSGWEVTNFYTETDTSLPITGAQNIYTLADMESQLFANSFKKKETKYFANLINTSPATNGEIIWGESIMGVKGAYATVKLKYQNQVLQNKAELFAVSSEYIESSY
tara:strand:- start:63 stop:1589 length:1527 start_codon:yes stop_codon:yes gene_type:complete